MPSVLPLSVADAKLAEKKAWRRYADARDNDWREALRLLHFIKNTLLCGGPPKTSAKSATMTMPVRFMLISPSQASQLGAKFFDNSTA